MLYSVAPLLLNAEFVRALRTIDPNFIADHPGLLRRRVTSGRCAFSAAQPKVGSKKKSRRNVLDFLVRGFSKGPSRRNPPVAPSSVNLLPLFKVPARYVVISEPNATLWTNLF